MTFEASGEDIILTEVFLQANFLGGQFPNFAVLRAGSNLRPILLYKWGHFICKCDL